ncbi:MAG: 2-phospho-L-lactate guanylyltransferase [Anaerolineales bacterium]|nr:2-phospho-L-lactate guanylyltransferase [Anaerolineales bacterium]
MIWAIVPIKPLEQSKSRLSDILSRKNMAELSKDLLIKTLQVLDGSASIEKTLVVSRDTAVLALARTLGAKTVTERGNPELNAALERATAVAIGYGVSAVLILPADLPLLGEDDIESMVALLKKNPEVVIAPDRHEKGTNALLVSPPGILPYSFGENSFQRHLELAEQAGVLVHVYRNEDIGLDIDVPEDLQLLNHERQRTQKTILYGVNDG